MMLYSVVAADINVGEFELSNENPDIMLQLVTFKKLQVKQLLFVSQFLIAYVDSCVVHYMKRKFLSPVENIMVKSVHNCLCRDCRNIPTTQCIGLHRHTHIDTNT